MKIYIKKENNLLNYHWFKQSYEISNNKKLCNMGSVEIVGERIFLTDELMDFLEICGNKISEKGDIVVRWGDDSVDAEIDLIFNPDFILL